MYIYSLNFTAVFEINETILGIYIKFEKRKRHLLASDLNV